MVTNSMLQHPKNNSLKKKRLLWKFRIIAEKNTISKMCQCTNETNFCIAEGQQLDDNFEHKDEYDCKTVCYFYSNALICKTTKNLGTIEPSIFNYKVNKKRKISHTFSRNKKMKMELPLTQENLCKEKFDMPTVMYTNKLNSDNFLNHCAIHSHSFDQSSGIVNYNRIIASREESPFLQNLHEKISQLSIWNQTLWDSTEVYDNLVYEQVLLSKRMKNIGPVIHCSSLKTNNPNCFISILQSENIVELIGYHAHKGCSEKYKKTLKYKAGGKILHMFPEYSLDSLFESNKVFGSIIDQSSIISSAQKNLFVEDTLSKIRYVFLRNERPLGIPKVYDSIGFEYKLKRNSVINGKTFIWQCIESRTNKCLCLLDQTDGNIVQNHVHNHIGNMELYTEALISMKTENYISEASSSTLKDKFNYQKMIDVSFNGVEYSALNQCNSKQEDCLFNKSKLPKISYIFLKSSDNPKVYDSLGFVYSMQESNFSINQYIFIWKCLEFYTRRCDVLLKLSNNCFEQEGEHNHIGYSSQYLEARKCSVSETSPVAPSSLFLNSKLPCRKRDKNCYFHKHHHKDDFSITQNLSEISVEDASISNENIDVTSNIHRLASTYITEKQALLSSKYVRKDKMIIKSNKDFTTLQGFQSNKSAYIVMKENKDSFVLVDRLQGYTYRPIKITGKAKVWNCSKSVTHNCKAAVKQYENYFLTTRFKHIHSVRGREFSLLKERINSIKLKTKCKSQRSESSKDNCFFTSKSDLCNKSFKSENINNGNYRAQLNKKSNLENLQKIKKCSKSQKINKNINKGDVWTDSLKPTKLKENYDNVIDINKKFWKKKNIVKIKTLPKENTNEEKQISYASEKKAPNIVVKSNDLLIVGVKEESSKRGSVDKNVPSVIEEIVKHSIVRDMAISKVKKENFQKLIVKNIEQGKGSESIKKFSESRIDDNEISEVNMTNKITMNIITSDNSFKKSHGNENLCCVQLVSSKGQKLKLKNENSHSRLKILQETSEIKCGLVESRKKLLIDKAVSSSRSTAIISCNSSGRLDDCFAELKVRTIERPSLFSGINVLSKVQEAILEKILMSVLNVGYPVKSASIHCTDSFKKQSILTVLIEGSKHCFDQQKLEMFSSCANRPPEHWIIKFLRKSNKLSQQYDDLAKMSYASFSWSKLHWFYKSFEKSLKDNYNLEPQKYLNVNNAQRIFICDIYNHKGIQNCTQISPKNNFNILCCVNSTGQPITPFIITRKSQKESVCINGENGKYYSICSRNGKLNSDIFHKWFQIFDDELVQMKIHRPIILFLNCKNACLTYNSILHAENRNIALYFIPPKSNQALNPLYTTIFPALKENLVKMVGKDAKVKKFPYVFVKAYKELNLTILSEEAFEEAGLCPFNGNVLDRRKSKDKDISEYEIGHQNKKIDSCNSIDKDQIIPVELASNSYYKRPAPPEGLNNDGSVFTKVRQSDSRVTELFPTKCLLKYTESNNSIECSSVKRLNTAKVNRTPTASSDLKGIVVEEEYLISELTGPTVESYFPKFMC